VLKIQAILLTTFGPLNKVKVDVPTALDQVPSKGTLAVRPVIKPVNERADLAPRIPKLAKHHCKPDPRRENNLILQNEEGNN
jgi:hypothetical protein